MHKRGGKSPPIPTYLTPSPSSLPISKPYYRPIQNPKPPRPIQNPTNRKCTQIRTCSFAIKSLKRNVVPSQSTTLPFKHTNQWKKKPFFRTHFLSLQKHYFSNAPSKWYIFFFPTQQVDSHTLSLILKIPCQLDVIWSNLNRSVKISVPYIYIYITYSQIFKYINILYLYIYMYIYIYIYKDFKYSTSRACYI